MTLQKWIPARWETLFTELLTQRGVTDPSALQSFFEPEITAIAPVSSLHDISTAVERIELAIHNNEKIYVYGDYDADGVCATTILWEYLYRERKANVLPYIPSRFEHGYGLHPDALKELSAQGAQLIITVDCGIRDTALITQWQKKGLSFIVTDHHQPDQQLPPCPIVHPMHPQGLFPNQRTSGGVVAWYLVLALVQHQKGKLEESDYFGHGLDLAGFSLVTDMMPLLGDNRTIVQAALQQIRLNPRLGIQALAEASQLKTQEISAYHIGHVLGPRINAAGRLGDAMEGVRLLSTRESSRSRQLSGSLVELNTQRQSLTEQVVQEIIGQIEKHHRESHIIAIGKDWNEGVIGLVAARLFEKYQVPTFVIVSNEKQARGSARSAESLNIVNLIETAAKHLTSFGGHAAAAGFSTTQDKLEAFSKAIAKQLQKPLKSKAEVAAEVFDYELPVEDLSTELLDLLQLLEPHGLGNPIPKFSISGGVLQDFRLVGSNEDHLAFRVSDKNGNLIKAIKFRGADIYTQLEPNQPVTVTGKLAVDSWNGFKQVQIIVDKVL